MRNFRILAPFLLVAPLFLLLINCTHETQPASTADARFRVRVRLLESTDHLALSAPENPHFSVDSNPGDRTLGLARGIQEPVTLVGNSWKIGSVTLGSGKMTLSSNSPQGIRINGVSYRGNLVFLKTGDGKFDLINDLPVDDYLKGVVTKEMPASWKPEALKAQAIVARTYVLYEAHTGGLNRYWDVYPDERSQMYGGIDAETPQGCAAVDATMGVVVTYGPGLGRIFKTYFSSCCGGVSQSANDAFPSDPVIPPLGERVTGPCCDSSKYVNWGPITLKGSEITRRVRLWGQRREAADGRSYPEAQLSGLSNLAVASTSRFGRPTRMVLTDSHGTPFSFAAEEMRTAIDTDATAGTRLPSDYCKIKYDPASDTVTFYDGHGFGHGVGMCQYCAQAYASAGQNCTQILLASYPQSKLEMGY